MSALPSASVQVAVKGTLDPTASALPDAGVSDALTGGCANTASPIFWKPVFWFDLSTAYRYRPHLRPFMGWLMRRRQLTVRLFPSTTALDWAARRSARSVVVVLAEPGATPPYQTVFASFLRNIWFLTAS